MKRTTIVVLINIVILVGLFVFLLIHRFFTPGPDTTAVVKEIRSLNRWETSSFTIEKIIDSGTGGNALQKFFFGNRILLIAHGEVIGGFDLSGMSDKAVHVDNTSIDVTLPAPKILLTRLDTSKTRVYDRQQGLLVPQNNNLETDALASAQQQLQDAACTEGILTQTTTNAKNELTSLLYSLGFKAVTITIPTGHC